MTSRGFLLGKFMPPHSGHLDLVDFARGYADEVTVLVCSIARERIPGVQRHRWMVELCPGSRVLHCDEEVPQAPEEHPDFWRIWRELVRRFHPAPIDFVFASESYGHRLAVELGARFVPVDPQRLVRSISASAIRAEPFAHWSHIPPPVRPYYARRVAVWGPESAGKTTLAQKLAARFHTVCVPEYGRIHTDAFGSECGNDDLLRIARGQVALRRALARSANRVIVEDTDELMTAVWSDMLTGRRDPWFAQLRECADLYLLLDIDVPWVDDGTRYFPSYDVRRKFFEACRLELDRLEVNYRVISGDYAQRTRTAIEAVRAEFGLG